MVSRQDMAEARSFLKNGMRDQKHGFAICLKSDDRPIGHVHVEAEDDSHDLGYALCKAYWHQGLVSEACLAVIDLVKAAGMPYITATHDKNNQRSGAVMKRIGMSYRYSYKELWQPKNVSRDLSHVSAEPRWRTRSRISKILGSL